MEGLLYGAVFPALKCPGYAQSANISALHLIYVDALARLAAMPYVL